MIQMIMPFKFLIDTQHKVEKTYLTKDGIKLKKLFLYCILCKKLQL